MQSENFKNREQNLCEKIVILSVKISQIKNKISKLAEKSLYYDDIESSESEKEILLKKQLMKTFKSEKFEK